MEEEEEFFEGVEDEEVFAWEVVDGIGGTLVAEEDIWVRLGAILLVSRGL